jgi:aminoglycoside phosphotransferase (APT) family kinase protein
VSDTAASLADEGPPSDRPTPPKRTLGLPTKEQRRDLDATRPVLEAWLSRHFPERQELRVVELAMPGGAGVANETLIADVEWNGATGRSRQGLVVRVETRDGLFPAKSFSNQYLTCQALAGIDGLPVARIVGWEEDRSVLGDAFYVMDRLPGRSCPDSPPFHGSGWVAELSTEKRAHMWRQAVAAIARINAVDVAKLGFLHDRRSVGTGWEQEFAYYCEFRDWAIFGERNPVIDQALDWLWKNKPSDTPTELSWGDARFANLMFDDEANLTGVLDWDMVSLAGGESDLAWWIVTHYNATHACGLRPLAGIGSPRQTIALWEQLAGRRLVNFDYHLVFAAFRNGIIVVRLARQLQKMGLIPPESEYLIHNNRGIQYLTTMLDLKPNGPITIPWPGLD